MTTYPRHQSCPVRDPASGPRSLLFGLLTLLGLFASVLIASAPLAAQPGGGSVVVPGTAEPVDSTAWRIGGTLLYGLSSSDVLLDVYQGFPGCGIFTERFADEMAFRLFLERPLRVARLSLIAGVGAESRAIRFAETSSTPARTGTGEEREVVTQHRFDATGRSVGLFAGLLYTPFEAVRLTLTPSFSLLSVDDVAQYEEIVSPLGAVFTESGDFRRPIDRGGTLDFATTLVAIRAGAGVRLPLGRHLLLLPEFAVTRTITSLERGREWGTTTYAVGIGAAWEIHRRDDRDGDPIVDVVPPPDTPLVELPVPPVIAIADTPAVATPPPFLSASITAYGVDEQGREFLDPVIEIREAPWTRSIPLIPHLFFANRSAAISERYHLFNTPAEADRFGIDSLPHLNPFAVHHHLLNILGLRLRSRPEVTVTIVGTTAANEGADSAARQALGRARAGAVADYLVRIWSIDRRRITVTAGVPTSPSSEETAEGREENRRAEFTFDGESLLQPVLLERMARIASPPSIRFDREVVTATEVARSIVRVTQGGRVLLEHIEGDTVSTTPSSKYWPLGDLRVDRALLPFRYRFEVTDITGQTAVDSGEFTVREEVSRTPEEEIEVKEYLLVGFVYNSADLRSEHLSQIYEIARTAEEGAWVEVAGFTDRVGDDARNYELAQQRADTVAAAVSEARRRLGLPALTITTVRGAGNGEDGETTDNGLPEGRIFSRMVRVTVSRQGKR